MEASNVSDTLARLRADYETLRSNTDTFFRIIMVIFIFLTQCGFAFLECGSVRSKNATNILVKNMANVLFAAVAFWSLGYALSFGAGSPFVGYTNFFVSSPPAAGHTAGGGTGGDVGGGAFFSLWMFHYVVAATPATMVSGAMAERCRFTAGLLYTFAITGIVHPVVAHWTWSEQGWLRTGGYQDFAGSGAVHLLGGCCALVGSYMLGSRRGRFGLLQSGQNVLGTTGKLHMRGHSVPLSALGGFILLFGFLSFVASSSSNTTAHILYDADDGYKIARAIKNVVLTASTGAFGALIMNRLIFAHKWSFLVTLNGALTAIVAVSASANTIQPWAAVLMGAITGCSFLFTRSLLEMAQIDDAIDTIAVHGGGGLLGIILGPLFSTEYGLFYTGSGKTLGWNILGGVSIILWSALVSLLLFGVLRYKNKLRVSDDDEEEGLDVTKHGEPAYPAEAYGHGWGEAGDQIKHLVAALDKGAMSAFGKREQAAISSQMQEARQRRIATAEHPELKASMQMEMGHMASIENG